MNFNEDLRTILVYCTRRISENPRQNTLEKLFQKIELFIRNYPNETSKIDQSVQDLKYNFEHSVKAIKVLQRQPALSLREENHNAKIAIVELLSQLTGEKMQQKHQSNKVFIVHGHENAMKERVARIVTQLGLSPIILAEQTTQGSSTIIEKFERHSNVSYAIVLLSPDDFGFSKSDPNSTQFSRSRQNVIFEFGYFVGKIGRNCVFPLYKKSRDFEIPSDVSGVLLNEFDDNDGWVLKLARELKACGYSVDMNSVT